MQRLFTRINGGAATLNGTRLTESFIIAAVTGVISAGGSFFVTVPKLEVKFDQLDKSVTSLQANDSAKNREISSVQSDIVRLQAQMLSVQAEQNNMQRQTNERLVFLERTVFKIPNPR